MLAGNSGNELQKLIENESPKLLDDIKRWSKEQADEINRMQRRNTEFRARMDGSPITPEKPLNRLIADLHSNSKFNGTSLEHGDWCDPASIFAAVNAAFDTTYPIVTIETPAQVKKEALERSEQIFWDRELLCAILDRHESTIVKRWMKKSRPQRVKTLLAAWPNISASHRPDILAYRRESVRQRLNGTKYRNAYVFPQINLEDLSTSKTLLLFLQASARNEPTFLPMRMATSNSAACRAPFRSLRLKNTQLCMQIARHLRHMAKPSPRMVKATAFYI
jgi:hypothetical protein